MRLYEKGLIYRGERIINWCPRCQTALSDEEAEHQEKNGKLYHIRYPFKNNPKEGVIVATTRPETMLGDTAVAVNPKDSRYIKLIGRILVLPLVGREIKIIADDFVSAEFGTGAVKVTPAHDPNDFVIGQRHKLEMINIMHPDGRLNEQAGKFNGLDRFEGRKRVIAALDMEGYLVKTEDHKHAVGHCYRCDTMVEPYLSKQWFVKMSPLAKPALKAVKNGTIKIYPEHWQKVYTNWMEDIRDWCISRQIWWGHRIPVWYCVGDEACQLKCKEPIVSKTTPEQCPHCGSKNLRQDEDVLDTWFSSWLWPFVTLGWPKDNADLKYFYPTHTLLTASEIIFFWVARMIMAGYEFMGQPPFSEVFIHGTVRDSRGRKMSKSLGNAIDPLEIIDQYGADALRFSLIINSGQDIFISKEKFEIGRNFANKIWNAARLIFTNCGPALEAGDYETLDVKALDLPSRWIISRFYETLDKTSKAIETFRYSEAENLVQDFFWGSFCDWYLEFIKGKFTDIHVQKTALFILKNSLKLLHPFVPFVTEEIYSKMNTKDSCLSVVSWPSLPWPVSQDRQKSLIDTDAFEQMQTVIDVIWAIRNIRTQWNVKPQDSVDVVLVPVNRQQEQLLEKNQGDIQRLGKVKTLTIDSKVQTVKDAASVVVNALKVFIPLGVLVDLAAEKKRMSQEVARKQKTMEGLQTRLNNPVFVDKAPRDVISKEKDRLSALGKDVKELQTVLANLS